MKFLKNMVLYILKIKKQVEDYYELLAEMNGKKTRYERIDSNL